MGYIYEIPLKALREITNYIDSIQESWVQLNLWHAGVSSDVDASLRKIHIHPNGQYHFIECKDKALSEKVLAMLERKGAKISPTPEGEKERWFVFIAYLAGRRDLGVQVNISVADRTEGQHIRQENSQGKTASEAATPEGEDDSENHW